MDVNFNAVNFNDADVHTEEWSIYTEYTISRVTRYTGGKYRGFEIVHKKDIVLGDVPARGTLPLRELVVHYPKGRSKRYALYTFK